MPDYNSTTTSKTIYNARGNPVGYVRPGGVFVRKFHDQHVLRNPPALALEVFCLDQLATLGVERMILTNKDTGESYRCSLEHFIGKSFEIDRGFGLQRALPLSGFTRSKPGGELEVTPTAPAAPKRQDMQLCMFGNGR